MGFDPRVQGTVGTPGSPAPAGEQEGIVLTEEELYGEEFEITERVCPKNGAVEEVTALALSEQDKLLQDILKPGVSLLTTRLEGRRRIEQLGKGAIDLSDTDHDGHYDKVAISRFDERAEDYINVLTISPCDGADQAAKLAFESAVTAIIGPLMNDDQNTIGGGGKPS